MLLENLKKAVVRAAKDAEAMGLCKHRSGNFSALERATGLICLTPSGVDRRGMDESDIVVMDMMGRIVEAKEGRVPSSEYMMHIAAYETRPDVVAVAHTHSPYALVMAVLRKTIPPVMAEMMHLNLRAGHIPVTNYAKAGTKMLAESVESPLIISDAVLIANHGVLTVDDESVDEALLKAAYVEEAAMVYYRVLLIGEDVPEIPIDDI